ncbi:hypothetical protein EVAR_102160_1 [Eumeta japonica]|uniref:Uncharacterized protein n=1 Tax=Eumeta variegata TaxID=151549 RepID=A0A4C1TZU2_EUMVA|nr:hypothetical protein EVAR_102160_1 [Eumeta japonica]
MTIYARDDTHHAKHHALYFLLDIAVTFTGQKALDSIEIPHNLTEAQKLHRVNWCCDNLRKFAGGDLNAIFDIRQMSKFEFTVTIPKPKDSLLNTDCTSETLLSVLTSPEPETNPNKPVTDVNEIRSVKQTKDINDGPRLVRRRTQLYTHLSFPNNLTRCPT